MKTLLHFFLFSMSTVTLIDLCANVIPVHSQCLEDQKISLLHLKESLNPSSLYSKLRFWNSSTGCCSWGGVTCSTNGSVVGLDLSREGLTSGIDNSSSLFDLQHLQSLNLAYNGFYLSQIPSAIGKLKNLKYLNLSTAYGGQIPIEISHLTRLVTLDLSSLFLFGPLTPLKLENPNLNVLIQNLSELVELHLDGVNISAQGTEWCQAISSSLPNLRVLSLSSCGLSGPIDSSLMKLPSLSVIHLEYNYLSTQVPGFFSNFTNLTSLRLGHSGLDGSFPKEIFQIPTLETIDLSSNQLLQGSLPDFPNNGSLLSLVLSETKFSGSLPNSIGNLKMLSKIDISSCNFTGSIPRSIEDLTRLVYLDLSRNKFNGPIPSLSMAKNLTLINLSYNHLTGQINSSHWENLTNLASFDLENNLLDGTIPPSLFSLPMLQELHLSSNQFSGQLLEFAATISVLDTLDLSSNNLEGPIPMSIFNLRRLEYLLLSSNNFSGSFPLNGPQQLRNLTKLDLSYNSILITYDDHTNSSYSSFPLIQTLNLASAGKLRGFPEFLKDLSMLDDLNLSKNQIHGMVPNWIWKITSLNFLNLSYNALVTLEGPLSNLTSTLYSLDLHSNQLQGQIPFLPFTSYLDYSRNNFNSSIPPDIPIQRAIFFSLSSNNFHGIIPGSLCNASNLQVLDLSNNSLSGIIPQCLYAMSHLEVLNLRRNNLTGSIPDKFPTNCTLVTLDLSRNMVQGKIPKSLVNCTMLAVLNLGNNQITDAFPHFLKEISTLRVLVLRSNRFYGNIECPKTNGTRSSMLQIIDLADNNISGEIAGNCVTTWRAMMADKDPSSELNHPQPQVLGSTYYKDAVTVISKGLEVELVKILTVYTSVDFSCNNFNGLIPKEIGELNSLYILNLSRNALTGEIPSSLGNLLQVESLDLSKNKLSGQIPAQLAKLTFLSVLDLSNNQLVGMIPTGGQFSTFPKASFTGNKGLWGPPLSVDNKTGFSPPPTLNGSLPSSGHHEIDWDLISAEIGFTFGLGVAIASLVFCKRWSKWYYKVMYNIILKIFPQLEERFGHHQRHAHINQRWRH